VVAVIDTGVLPNHEDVVGSRNYVGGFDVVTDRARANDGDGRDGDPTDPGDGVAAGECFPGSPALPASWHGTHVAGTVGIGGTNNAVGVAGVNWRVKVQAVRVLGKCGGTIADINDGIRWAAGLPVPGAPNNPHPAKVINMSLGGRGRCTLSPSTQAAIDDAVNAGAAVVVAAGNEAADASGFFPASCEHVITVAASDYRGHLVTRYSNFGQDVDLLAPGGDVARDDNGDGQNDGVLSMVRGGDARETRRGLPMLKVTDRETRFLAVMAMITGLVFAAYREEVIGPPLGPLVLATAEMTVALLHWVGIEAVRSATVIAHPGGFAYEVAYSCIGFLPVVFYAAAVLAYPVGWTHRLV